MNRQLLASIGIPLFGIVAACSFQAPAKTTATTLPDVKFDKLLAVIRPAEGEDPFATIPWETNLWDARVKAAKLGKPLLLWEMDGHPLGCG